MASDPFTKRAVQILFHVNAEPRKQIAFSLAFLWLGLAVVIALADRAPLHLQTLYPQAEIGSSFYDYIEGVVERTLPGPFVYRLLVPYAYTFTRHFGFDLLLVDFAVKVGLLWLCQLVFFRYLRRFVPGLAAVAGVFLLDVLVAYSLSYISGPSAVETMDLVNLLVFVLALEWIHAGRLPALCAVLAVGTLNRETVWVLVFIFALRDWLEGHGLRRVMWPGLAVAVPYFGVRLLVPSDAVWFGTKDLVYNIPFLRAETTWQAVLANTHVFFLLAPLIGLAAIRFREHPRFLQIAAAMTPVFILVHYVFGSIIERRLWMPLYVLLIPLVVRRLQGWFGGERQ